MAPPGQDDVRAFKAARKDDGLSGGKVYEAMRKELNALVVDRIAAWRDAKVTVEELLDELRAEEGASVTINYDNPDFNGQPERTIEVAAPWNSFIGTTYGGDTLLKALQTAVEAKRKAKKE